MTSSRCSDNRNLSVSIIFRLLGAVFIMVCCITSLTYGDTLFVTPGGSGTACSQASPCTLSYAVGAAPSSSTLYMGAGTYTGSGSAPVLSVTQDLTIIGGWDGSETDPPVTDSETYVTVIDGEESRQCVNLSPGVSVTVEGLTVANGYMTTAVADTTLYGAGLYSADAVQVILRSVIFDSNVVYIDTSVEGTYAFGGGAYVKGGTLSVEDCSFKKNAGWAKIDTSGAGLAIEETTDSEVTGCLFQDNDAWSASGLYFNGGSSGNSPLSIENCRFMDNGQGNSNEAYGGYSGAVEIRSANATVEENTFRGNHAANDDGAVDISASELTFKRNWLIDNSCGETSALHLYSVSPFTVAANVISGNQSNHATDSPAAMIKGGSGSISQNTVAGNDSSYGIEVKNNATVTLTNNILAQADTGIFVETGSSAVMDGTLWWQNAADTGGGGTINTGSVNVYEDPLFIDPTEFDYHVQSGSAARNTGVSSTVSRDIDGDPCPRGGAHDIGADEYMYTVLPFVPGLLLDE